MGALKPQVRSGRLAGDVVDSGDELDEKERARLHAALREAWASARAGQTMSAEELLHELAARER